MKTRTFSLIIAIVFLLIGIAGFVSGLLTPPDPAHDLKVQSHFGFLMGLFPVNILHDAVHILFGIGGILAYRSFSGARAYSKVVAVVYAVFTVMGLIPGLDTTFGLVPLYGNDIWLHAVIAIVAAWFGFSRVSESEDTARTTAYRT
jgi:hypothetical protein